MMTCWEEEPVERPAFSELTERLEQIIQEDVPYMKMDSEKGILKERKQQDTAAVKKKGETSV